MNFKTISLDLESASNNIRSKSPPKGLLERKQVLFLLISLVVHAVLLYFAYTEVTQSEIKLATSPQNHIKAKLYTRQLVKVQPKHPLVQSKKIPDIEEDTAANANADTQDSQAEFTPIKEIQGAPQISEKINEKANTSSQQAVTNQVTPLNILSSKLDIEGQTPQATRTSISIATQSYLSDMFEDKHDELVNQATQSHRSNRRSPAIKAPSTNQGSGNEAFLEDIKVEVDCSTIKGKIFSMISANKGVQVQDRDFPANNQAPDNRVGGTVKCRPAGDISSFINARKERNSGSFR